MDNIFVGRQPIFDRQLNVVGYELLYRAGSDSTRADFIDPDQATSQIIANIFLEVGLERLVGTKKAYINFTERFLNGTHPIPFTPEQIVIEVPETLPLTPANVAHLQQLVKRGYQIALDDVACMDAVKAAIDIVRIIKIDLRMLPAGMLAATLREMRRFPALLLAEKVETEEEFLICKDLGVDLYQGFFLSKPKVITGQKLAPSRLVVLQMLARLQDPNITLRELEQILAQDVSLGIKLLRLVNSTYFGLPVQIKSLNQAMAMLGLVQIRMWLSLFLLSETDDKPRELTTIALQRARMCEQTAAANGCATPERYFLTGLLSVIEALYNRPLREILTLLPLANEISAALLQYEGSIGSVLRMVLAYEQAEWDVVRRSGFDIDLCRRTYLEAITWTRHIEELLKH